LARDGGLSVGVLPFPIGLDLARVTPGARGGAELLFVGAMHRDANVDAIRHFCDAVLPRVRAEVPEARLTIVGADPPAEVRRLAASPGVQVTGFVEALEPYYARATAFVSPLRIAGGIPGKNLDAMAAGCPIVTTTLGNEGLGATPGEHLLTADTPGDFAAAVVRLHGPSLGRQVAPARGAREESIHRQPLGQPPAPGRVQEPDRLEDDERRRQHEQRGEVVVREHVDEAVALDVVELSFPARPGEV